MMSEDFRESEARSRLQRPRTLLGQSMTVLNYLLLVLFSLLVILPFLNIVALSLNSGRDAARGGVYFWPRVFTFENYAELFKDNKMINGYKITLFRTIVGTAAGTFLTAMAAWVLRCKTLPGRGFLSFFVFFTMLFSGGVIPYYMVLKALHLKNTIWVYVIPSLYSAWNLIIIRTFFQTIDASLEESAKIDGYNDFQIFVKVILPLSKPVLAVVALFFGVAHWNDWFTGMFYVSDKNLYPAQTILQQMLTMELKLKELSINSAQAAASAQKLVTGESLKMATVVVTTLPIVCVYPFIQKYFVKGTMIGAIKG